MIRIYLQRYLSYWIQLRQHSALRQEWWFTLLLAISLSLILANTGVLGFWNRFIYDKTLSLSQYKPDKQILMIAIDDKSLAELGQWPWSRIQHGELLVNLATAGVKATFLNFLFDEPSSNSTADTALAAAMSQTPVYLPMMIQDNFGLSERKAILPIRSLREVAAGVGHLNVSPDIDGVARVVFIEEYTKNSIWQQIGLLMAKQTVTPGKSTFLTTPGERNPQIKLFTFSSAMPIRDYRIGIPFVNGTNHYQQVSYIDVLHGNIAPELLRDRYVLVGAMTQPLGTLQLTPNSSEYGGLQGLEIQANILDALLNNRAITLLPSWQNDLLLCTFILALMLAFTWLPSELGLLATLLFSALILFFNGSFLLLLHISFGSGEALFGVWFAYLFWSWRRLVAANHYFSYQLTALTNTSTFLAPKLLSQENVHDITDRNIAQLKNVIDKMQTLQTFILKSLQSLPVGVCVYGLDKKIIFSNSLFDLIFTPFNAEQTTNLLSDSESTLLGQSFEKILKLLSINLPSNFTIDSAAQTKTPSFELTDALNRHFRVEITPIKLPSEDKILGWLASFIDLTTIRQSEHQRADMVQFLSHDLRKPQVAILALLELQNKTEKKISPEALNQEINKNVQRTLSLTSSYLQLTQSELSPYLFSPFDFADLIIDACDIVWPQAKTKGVRLIKQLPGEPMIVSVDAALMVRALVNLIENAVHFSEPTKSVTLNLSSLKDKQVALFQVIDEGIGIAEEDIKTLFKPFKQIQSQSTLSDEKGHGLGLAQARAAVIRHGGTIECKSQVNIGTTFSIALPLCLDDSPFELALISEK